MNHLPGRLPSRPRRPLSRCGFTSVELMLVFATFVISAFFLFNLGAEIIEVYFRDGNQCTTSPLI